MSAHDLVKIRNRNRNRSHKCDRIGARRIRMFPFSTDSSFDSIAYVLCMI